MGQCFALKQNIQYKIRHKFLCYGHLIQADENI